LMGQLSIDYRYDVRYENLNGMQFLITAKKMPP